MPAMVSAGSDTTGLFVDIVTNSATALNVIDEGSAWIIHHSGNPDITVFSVVVNGGTGIRIKAYNNDELSHLITGELLQVGHTYTIEYGGEGSDLIENQAGDDLTNSTIAITNNVVLSPPGTGRPPMSIGLGLGL